MDGARSDVRPFPFAVSIISCGEIVITVADNGKLIMTDETGAKPVEADFYKELLSSMADVVFQRIRRADGRIEFSYLSQGLQDLFGLDPKEVVSDANVLLDALHPDDREEFLDTLKKSEQTAAPWSLQFRIISKQGVEKWIDGSSTVLREENGEVLWNGILREITDRKHLEVKSAGQTATIDAIFTNMAQGMVYYDRDLIVVAHNNQALNMLGLSQDSVGDNEPFENWLRHATAAGRRADDENLEQRIARRMDIARKFEPYSEDLVRADGATVEVR